ncbi:MAG: diacylglycerol kinase family lipid kinase [Verrucomicrobia bacterium]|nr:diacylglycerol kinase family lipid kinase [Verrucomicrobiota bacterium]
MSPRVLLIVNPAAAGGLAHGRCGTVLDLLSARGIAAEQALTSHAGHAVEIAQQAAKTFDILAAVGGDGTVNEVANGLLLAGAAATRLAVVPVGTGNDVAQLVGIGSVTAAVEAIVAGQIRAIDVIEVVAGAGGAKETRYALLLAAIGFATEILKKTTPRVKRLFGPRYCYSVGFFRALFSYRAPFVLAECEGRRFAGRMLLACAGNSPFAGGGVMHFSPGAQLDDGLLNVSLIDTAGRLETLRLFPRLLKGTHVHHRKVRYFTAPSLSVESDPPVPIQIDGDHFGATPATFTVRPRALRIVVPSEKR